MYCEDYHVIILQQDTHIDYIDNFFLRQSDGNAANEKKETEATALNVKVAKVAWENSGVEVSIFLTNGELVISNQPVILKLILSLITPLIRAPRSYHRARSRT